jgi:hypothetical protein
MAGLQRRCIWHGGRITRMCFRGYRQRSVLHRVNHSCGSRQLFLPVIARLTVLLFDKVEDGGFL